TLEQLKAEESLAWKGPVQRQWSGATVHEWRADEYRVFRVLPDSHWLPNNTGWSCYFAAEYYKRTILKIKGQPDQPIQCWAAIAVDPKMGGGYYPLKYRSLEQALLVC